jgi:hypothetical protein
MHTHRYLFAIVCACGVSALGVAAQASQAPQSSPSASPSQSATLTGCVEYGPRDTYILATMDVPQQPALSDQAALARQELAAAEHSYEIVPAPGEHLSQLIGAKVRVAGAVSRTASPAATTPSARGAQTAPPALDRVNASSVQKLADHCDAHMTMFAL